uniref:Phage tail assembly protein n=1 Tax=Serratia marcescens TaxID=615 RepID=A0A1C3HHM5_SERMA|nr:Uncharacterised protein [Serratia marcescens]
MSESTEKFLLRYPYTTAGGQRIEELPLRRLAVRDMKRVMAANKDPANWDMPLIAAMVDLPVEDLDSMDLADYMVLTQRFQALSKLDDEPETVAES